MAEQPKQTIDPSDVSSCLRLLACGAVTEEHGMMRWSSNYTFLLAITEGDERALAVYKPQRGERPLWDFPDGTLCYREVSAFALSNALNWSIVPPTVLRDGPRGIGSMQIYVENSPEVNYFTLDQEVFADQLARISAFDYVINNADRKGGHILLDSDNHLWGIDHGIGFHAAPKLRTVIWNFAGQQVSEEILTDLKRVYKILEDVDSPLRQQLDRLLENSEVHALQARMRRLIQRGEHPRPGPGPNYPWPPV